MSLGCSRYFLPLGGRALGCWSRFGAALRSWLLVFAIKIVVSRLFFQVGVKIHLGQLYSDVQLHIVAFDFSKIVVDVELLVPIFLVVERALLELGLRAFCAGALDGDLWRRGRGRMRLEESPQLLRRLQLAVDQLQEDLVDDILVDCQLWSDAHLLHEGMRDALFGFRPYLEELVKALLHCGVLGRKSKPENRFRIIAREELES